MCVSLCRMLFSHFGFITRHKDDEKNLHENREPCARMAEIDSGINVANRRMGTREIRAKKKKTRR